MAALSDALDDEHGRYDGLDEAYLAGGWGVDTPFGRAWLWDGGDVGGRYIDWRKETAFVDVAASAFESRLGFHDDSLVDGAAIDLRLPPRTFPSLRFKDERVGVRR